MKSLLIALLMVCSITVNAQTRCKGKTVKDVQCAKRGDSTGYCHWHHPNKPNQCTAMTKKDKRCKNVSAKGANVCTIHQVEYKQYD